MQTQCQQSGCKVTGTALPSNGQGAPWTAWSLQAAAPTPGAPSRACSRACRSMLTPARPHSSIRAACNADPSMGRRLRRCSRRCTEPVQLKSRLGVHAECKVSLSAASSESRDCRRRADATVLWPSVLSLPPLLCQAMDALQAQQAQEDG